MIFVQPESGNQQTENLESGNVETTRNFEAENFETEVDQSGNDQSRSPPSFTEPNEKLEETNRFDLGPRIVVPSYWILTKKRPIQQQ